MRRNSTSDWCFSPNSVFYAYLWYFSFPALFVCRTVYYSIHGEEVVAKTADQNFDNSTAAVAYR